MSKENPGELTFDGLRRLLLKLGFSEPKTIRNCLALEHPASGTIIVLTIPADARTVRPADLLSVWVRLEANGLASEAVIDQLKIGRLPLAS